MGKFNLLLKNGLYALTALVLFSGLSVSAAISNDFTMQTEMRPVIFKGEDGGFGLHKGRPQAFSKRSAFSDRNRAASSGYNYLDGPDGTTWYYTAEYETEDVYYNEYYTDHILKTFTFRIYDGYRRLIGTVHDKIRYAENEIRDKECVIDPQVSLKFFNTDDKPEIMVFHAMNTPEYINHYYYAVYTVGGEKDEEGYDKEIARIEGRCIETINNSSNPRNENYLFTFVEDPYFNVPLDDPDYVEKLNNVYYKVITYTKALNDTDGPVVYITKNIGATRIPGDTTEGIYFMTKRYDNRLFFIYSQYEKPFFVDPRGSAEDESATPDNSLVIDVYEATGEEATFISTTQIPVNAVESDEKLVYTFLSIGSVAWTDDVDMKFHGTPEAPAFIVARDVAFAADIEHPTSSYYIYDTEGNKVVTIAEDTESMFLYRNGDPGGPLAMFVKLDENVSYIFVFAFLYSGEHLATINQYNDGDSLYASCYPIKIDGDYKFVFEMKYFDVDEDDNLYARVAWFGRGEDLGVLERIDYINLRQDVQRSLIYLSNISLNPKLFDNDDKMEYAALVSRSYGNTVRTEYIVADDNGGWYGHYTADDGKGNPTNLSIIPGYPNRMLVQYERGNTYVTLPFTQPSEGATNFSSVDEIIAGPATVTPEYYDLQGRKVKNPSQGIYIMKDGIHTRKVIIR